MNRESLLASSPLRAAAARRRRARPCPGPAWRALRCAGWPCQTPHMARLHWRIMTRVFFMNRESLLASFPLRAAAAQRRRARPCPETARRAVRCAGWPCQTQQMASLHWQIMTRGVVVFNITFCTLPPPQQARPRRRGSGRGAGHCPAPFALLAAAQACARGAAPLFDWSISTDE